MNRPMGARAGTAGRGHVRVGPGQPEAGRELDAAGRKGDGMGGFEGATLPQRARIGRPGCGSPARKPPCIHPVLREGETEA